MWRKIHDGPQIGGKLIGGVVAVEAGGVDDARHRAGARPGDHVDDDAVLFERLEDAEVRHAASRPPPRATPMRMPRRWWTNRSRPFARDRPQGNCGGASAILKSRLATSRRFGTTGATGTIAVQKPGDADLVAPAARRHVQRLQPADRGVARGGRHEEHRAIDESPSTARPCPRSRSAWTSKTMRVASCHSDDLLADLFGFQNPAIDAEGPESHARQTLATSRNR